MAQQDAGATAANGHAGFDCPICGKHRGRGERARVASLRPALVEFIAQRHPGWQPAAGLCMHCLNRARAEYVGAMLEAERGELSQLDTEVVESLKNQEMLTGNLNEAFEGQMSFGGRLADRM